MYWHTEGASLSCVEVFKWPKAQRSVKIASGTTVKKVVPTTTFITVTQTHTKRITVHLQSTIMTFRRRHFFGLCFQYSLVHHLCFAFISTGRAHTQEIFLDRKYHTCLHVESLLSPFYMIVVVYGYSCWGPSRSNMTRHTHSQSVALWIYKTHVWEVSPMINILVRNCFFMPLVVRS
jgi:hypothetical protein